MKKTICFFLFLALAAPQLALAQRNVVLIIADDLGTDYLGFYEDFQDTAPMPNIRKLLSRGVRFTNAMSNPVCSPTRAGILTGRYSFRTGVGSVVGGMGSSDQLDINEVTIPRLLNIYQPSGIAKANFGKWHLHRSIPANLMNPNVMGYDHFEGIFIGALPDYFMWTELINGAYSPVVNYATTETTDDAIAWIGDQGTKPFFLWLAYNAPHSPYHLPPDELHSNDTLTGMPDHILTYPKDYFKASLEALDHEIGRLFDSLEVHNLIDNTDIVFIGDNGNATQTAQISSTDRAKGTIYQYGVHVPFVIAGPSVVDPGRTSDALVNTVDLFATILELFGYTDWPSEIPGDKPTDSKSILPILANLSENVRPWAFTEIFKNTPDADDGKAMRNMNFKLLHFDEDGHQEFYNLAADPEEADNLLVGTLTVQELNNYYYLCSEMTALVGTGSYCDPAIVPTKDLEVAENSMTVYPNPFRSHIYVDAAANVSWFELTAPMGKVVFSGKNIEQQDFSNLTPGVYFLKLMGERSQAFKLEKE